MWLGVSQYLLQVFLRHGLNLLWWGVVGLYGDSFPCALFGPYGKREMRESLMEKKFRGRHCFYCGTENNKMGRKEFLDLKIEDILHSWVFFLGGGRALGCLFKYRRR